MDRREMLHLLGGGAVGLAAMAGREARAQHPHHHDTLHGECLKACTVCAEVCNETFHHGFEHIKDGHAEHGKAARLTIDCLGFCRLSADLLARESPLMGLACAACADACKACAEECSKHDDAQMKECAEACRACEKACRAMAERGGDHGHRPG